jgi:hypothetical protein
MMKCGETVFVKDMFGSYAKRIVAQCDGRFMLITHGLDPYNGNILHDWRQALDHLIMVTVPGKLLDKQMTAESHISGSYINVPLAYPLPITPLAELFGLEPVQVRAYLEDLAVQVTP